MYFDNLTWVSLIIFVVALGGFIYSCIVHNCLTNDHRTHDQLSQGTRPKAW
ncbi:MAG: hypothetical protein OEN52_09385 [Gammaproteobacteria bacterium]|nr:hypothetical protein [Gammaproteobacteria bacterium]